MEKVEKLSVIEDILDSTIIDMDPRFRSILIEKITKSFVERIEDLSVNDNFSEFIRNASIDERLILNSEIPHYGLSYKGREVIYNLNGLRITLEG